MSISVSQTDSLMDDIISVKITELKPHKLVTLSAQIKEKPSEIFISNGWYKADNNGDVDLAKDASLNGTYTGINPMGFLSSMVSGCDSDGTLALHKSDVTQPHKVELCVYDGHKLLKELLSEALKPISSIVINRWYLKPNVRRLEVNEGKIRGTLFIPAGNSTHPGIIDLYGSSGRLKETRAALLASRGFTTLALAYFQYLDLPSTLAEVDFSYFEEAVSWFKHHHNVQPGGVGVVGLSKGGEFANLMARYIPDIKCIVNINGAPFLSFFNLKRNGKLFQKAVEIDSSNILVENNAFTLKNAYQCCNSDIIPLWETKVKTLVITGQDDRQNNSEFYQNLSDLYPSDRKENLTILSYPNAGHLIQPPFTPLTTSTYGANFSGIILVNGGTNPGHSHAQTGAWKKMLKFLNENLNTSKSQL
ncbi:hypothetical protein LOTGIDRAFT_125734 [Lottia gigantea]|uniref:BAAT/Acyl-CoA thioester hydrolase C-terminal domain-containing protein n=1 Tax=Lottia gigantea TaxID=225164 RepID=V3ZWC8_LOTGI|nr:hypothetical protein LOTGIDRAFT_125734 [Lottia gigantea]ESO88692.1 hypothetical protein LOTGIDRAFT_125734 [Lottia gigantea]